MNTAEIEIILKDSLRPTRTTFLGVFPRDRIPVYDSLTQFPCSFVANTDPDGEPGTHWVAFYLESAQHVEFFDSYGSPPEEYKFSNQSVVHYNTHQFQDFSSNVCGQYTIYFVHHRSRSDTIHSVLVRMRKWGRFADHCVKIFVDNLIKSRILHLPTQRTAQTCKCRSK